MLDERVSSHQPLVADVGQDGVEEENADEQRGPVDDKKAAYVLRDGLWQLEIFSQDTCPAPSTRSASCPQCATQVSAFAPCNHTQGKRPAAAVQQLSLQAFT